MSCCKHLDLHKHPTQREEKVQSFVWRLLLWFNLPSGQEHVSGVLSGQNQRAGEWDLVDGAAQGRLIQVLPSSHLPATLRDKEAGVLSEGWLCFRNTWLLMQSREDVTSRASKGGHPCWSVAARRDTGRGLCGQSLHLLVIRSRFQTFDWLNPLWEGSLPRWEAAACIINDPCPPTIL